MIIPDSEGGSPLLAEATRELEAAIHDARVAFDCIGLGEIDRAHTSAVTARTAIDAAVTAVQAALAQAASQQAWQSAASEAAASEAAAARPATAKAGDERQERRGSGAQAVRVDQGQARRVIRRRCRPCSGATIRCRSEL